MKSPYFALLCAAATASLPATLGCSSEDLESPEPTPDYSYSMVTTIPAGTETEHCKFVQAPAEDIYINHDEVRYTKGSHHFLLYETPYASVPTTDNTGAPIVYLDEANGIFDCSEGVNLNYSVTRLVGGSQNSSGDSLVDLPPGVGVPVKAGAVLLMNAHYINASDGELKPEVNVDLFTVPPDELEQEGGILFWYDIFIRASAMSSSHATAICDIPEDITIANMQSHMHARGVDYDATVIAPDASRNPMYSNSAWEDVPVERYDPGLNVAAGSRIEYTCFYENPGLDDIYQGPRSSDEMCMVIASYYPATPHVSLCAGDPTEPAKTNFFGAEWIGQGSANCATSLACMQESLNNAGGGPFAVTTAISDCVMASDPAVSKEFSSAISCTLSSFTTGKNPFTECQPQFDACSAL